MDYLYAFTYWSTGQVIFFNAFFVENINYFSISIPLHFRFLFLLFPDIAIFLPFLFYFYLQIIMTFTIEPIKPTEAQSGVDFGAMINDLDLEKLSGTFISHTIIKKIQQL